MFQASKKALRERITQVLSKTSVVSVNEQSKAAISLLLASKEYRDAVNICVYLSIEGKEIQTAGLVKDALENNKTVFVPYTHNIETEGKSSSIMDMLALKPGEDHSSFKRDKWGIPTVPRESLTERRNCFGSFGLSGASGSEIESSLQLDLIVMPGMAFDRQLGRLGHGKGYYDRFLGKCKGYVDIGQMRQMPFLVALALNEQILPDAEQVPMSSDDWRVNRVISATSLQAPITGT